MSKVWVDEASRFDYTCPVCFDRHGGHALSVTHTYEPGCEKYDEVLRIVIERYNP